MAASVYASNVSRSIAPPPPPPPPPPAAPALAALLLGAMLYDTAARQAWLPACAGALARAPPLPTTTCALSVRPLLSVTVSIKL